MFGEENEEDWLTPDFKKQLAVFEQMYKQKEYSYIDSDQVEFIIDHLLLTNQLAKARWAADRALEHFPNNTGLLTRKAQVLSMSGSLNQALTILLDLERLESNNIEVLLTIAATYSQFKNSELAIRYYYKSYELATDTEKMDIAIDLAVELENVEQYHQAINVLEGAVKEGPVNDLVVFELAHCYEKVGDYKKAVKCYKDYIEEEPYSYTTWFNLGNTYVKQRMFPEAIWAYEYAVLIEESFIPALCNLASANFDNKNIPKAIELYKKCLEYDKEDPMVYCSIGECYEELGELEQAYEMYNKSTDLFPQFSDAWLGKGIMSDVLGFSERAIKELLIAVELEPFSSECWAALGNAYENAEYDELALKAYEKAIEHGADDNEAVVDYLAFLAKDSVESVYEAIESNTALQQNSIVKLVLIYAHWMANQSLEAILIFEELFESDEEIARELLFYFPEVKNDPYFKSKIEIFKTDSDEEL